MASIKQKPQNKIEPIFEVEELVHAIAYKEGPETLILVEYMIFYDHVEVPIGEEELLKIPVKRLRKVNKIRNLKTKKEIPKKEIPLLVFDDIVNRVEQIVDGSNYE